MAKFTSSQGKFTWSSGSASQEVETRDEIDNEDIGTLRDKTDYFSATCSSVHSNLESCFNEKMALFATYLLTDFGTDYDTKYEVYHDADDEDFYGTVYDTRYVNADSSLMSANYTGRNTKKYANYCSGNRVYNKSSWMDGAMTYYGSKEDSHYNGQGGTYCATHATDCLNETISDSRTNICSTRNSSYEFSVDGTDHSSVLSTEYTDHFSTFDDQ